MEAKDQNLPPEKKSLVRELLCPQLACAMVTGGMFAFTIFTPFNLDLPKPTELGEKSVKVDPMLNSPELLEKVAKKKPSVLLAKGKKQEAIDNAWKASKNNKKRQSTAWNMAIGNVLVESEKPRDRWKGYMILEKTVNNNPKASYPRLNYARKLYQGGFIEKALEQYEALLKLSKSDWIEPRLELANICLVADKTQRAIELFKQILEQKPNDPRLIKRLGLAMAIHGNKEEGFDTFVKGCTLEQDNLDYPSDIKKLIDDNAGLIESAISDVRQKVAASPDDIGLRITLAKLLTAVSRLPDAKKNLLEAKKKRETVPEIHEVLSEVLFRLGDRDQALAEFGLTANLLPLSQPAAPAEIYAPNTTDTAEEAESVAPPPEEPANKEEAKETSDK